MATTEAAQGTSFDEMVRLQQRAAALLEKDPYVLKYMSALGGGGSAGATNQGTMFIALVDPTKRPSADVCVAEITRRLSGIPGLAIYLQNPPSIRIGGRTSKALYQFTLQSSDIDELYTNAALLLTHLKKVPLITDVTTDLLNANPQVTVRIDRQRAASLGVTPSIIETSLAQAYNEQQVSTIYTTSNEYWVVMELLPSTQRDIPSLNDLYVRTSTGTVVPLSNVATFERSVGPVTVNHSGQVPSVTVSFNIPPNGSLSAAVASVTQIARQTLPSTITMGFSGQAQAFQSSVGNLGELLLVTVFVIYIILGILYESFIHPITILTGLPFATFGALLALFITHIELDVYGYVGIIMLIGIVKKNAIMMIDFAIAAERAGHTTPEQAIVKAASVRFRPIMMTTVAAIAGTLPIAIGIGATAASRRPLGVAVVGGLAFSQIVTLYVTPVFYTYLDELQGWLARRFAGRAIADAAIGRASRRANAGSGVGRLTHEHHDALHQAPGHDDAGHGRHPVLRDRRLPVAPRERSTERRLSHDHSDRATAGRESGNDGGHRRDTAREAILDDRRDRQHDVHLEPRTDADRRPVLARSEHRRRRSGHSGSDHADAAHATAGHPPAIVPKD